MNTIRPYFILSALPDNQIDWSKAKEYTKIMIRNDYETGHHGFPPIQGYWSKITLEDVGTFFNWGTEENMQPIIEEDIGKIVFFVTDGHHRTIAAQRAGIYQLECEIDTSGHVNIDRNIEMNT